MTFELLEGTDGRKMSSSWGNVINIVDTPTDMFGKVMSLKDELIMRYFTLATTVPLSEVHELMRTEKNPRNVKLVLASRLVAQYHGDAAARAAEQAFVNQFSKKELPDDIAAVSVKTATYMLSALLVQVGLAASKSEARRLIDQGGVKINQSVAPKDVEIAIGKKNNLLLQVGKRKCETCGEHR
jgi:tyrosyl-tRNA synthetase